MVLFPFFLPYWRCEFPKHYSPAASSISNLNWPDLKIILFFHFGPLSTVSRYLKTLAYRCSVRKESWAFAKLWCKPGWEMCSSKIQNLKRQLCCSNPLCYHCYYYLCHYGQSSNKGAVNLHLCLIWNEITILCLFNVWWQKQKKNV